MKSTERCQQLLVSQQERVHHCSKEEDRGQVNSSSGGDCTDGSDWDGFLCVSQVARSVRPSHDACKEKGVIICSIFRIFPTCHRGEEDSYNESEGSPDVDDDIAPDGFPPQVVLLLLCALGYDVSRVMVRVPQVLAEDSTADSEDTSGLGHVVVREIFVADIIQFRRLVLMFLSRVLQPRTETVPEVGSVHRALDTVGDLLHKPGAHCADTGTGCDFNYQKNY